MFIWCCFFFSDMLSHQLLWHKTTSLGPVIHYKSCLALSHARRSGQVFLARHRQIRNLMKRWDQRQELEKMTKSSKRHKRKWEILNTYRDWQCLKIRNPPKVAMEADGFFFGFWSLCLFLPNGVRGTTRTRGWCGGRRGISYWDGMAISTFWMWMMLQTL